MWTTSTISGCRYSKCRGVLQTAECEGQWVSPFTVEPSPRGDEHLETPCSVLSELDPLWLWWSTEAALVKEDVGFAFSLKSVIITVKSPTVTSRCWALLRSMFFNLGLGEKKKKKKKKIAKMNSCMVDILHIYRLIVKEKHLSNVPLFFGHELITWSFYGFSFLVLNPYHSCLFQIFLSFPFLGVWAVQTAGLLAVQPAEKQVVVFWKRQK